MEQTCQKHIRHEPNTKNTHKIMKHTQKHEEHTWICANTKHTHKYMYCQKPLVSLCLSNSCSQCNLLSTLFQFHCNTFYMLIAGFKWLAHIKSYDSEKYYCVSIYLSWPIFYSKTQMLRDHDHFFLSYPHLFKSMVNIQTQE